MKKNKNKNSETALQFENELMKMKMMAEKGAVIHTEKELPPAIENQFLKNIRDWEKAYENVQQIKVFDFIGKPEIKNWRSIKPDHLKHEIRKLEELLAQNGMHVDCLCEVPDKVYYKFLSAELMNHEIDNIRMPGWVTNFIYEEFHPNDEYDLKNSPEDFLQHIFFMKADHYSHLISKRFTGKNGKRIEHGKVVEAIEYFKKAFIKFSDLEVETGNLVFTKKKASITAYVKYKARAENFKTTTMKGDSFFKFHKDELGYWDVSSFSIPGLTI